MSLSTKLLRAAPRRQKMISQLFIRHQHYADEVHPGYPKLKRTQARFQVDDGCPVHLKRGLPDKILYGTTVLLCVIGMGMQFRAFYDMAFPAQQTSDDED